MKKRIGDVVTVENKDRKFGSTLNYHYVRVQLESGREVPLLFTDNEIAEAERRADANPEDLPKVSWLRNLID